LNYCWFLQAFTPGHAPIKNDEKCVSILDDIKSKGKKHWDIMGISIDLKPSDHNVNSLGILRALNLEFIRAKFIVVKMYGVTTYEVDKLLVEAEEILHRSGYMVYRDPHRAQIEGFIYTHIAGTLTSVFDFPTND